MFMGGVVLQLVSTATSHSWLRNVYIPWLTPSGRDNCADTRPGQPWDAELLQKLFFLGSLDLRQCAKKTKRLSKIWTISVGGQRIELTRTAFLDLNVFLWRV